MFDLIRIHLKKKLKKITEQGIKIKIIGRRVGLPTDIKDTIKNIEKRTSKNSTITINLALNYGSKEEIIDACQAMLKNKKKL